MMTERQFEARLKQIEEEFARGRERAEATRDQEMARLFEECGWQQERIAGKVGKNQAWVSRRLLFGRFLKVMPTGHKAPLPLENLSERRFRRCWALTDRKAGEDERFAQVIAGLNDLPGPDHVHPHMAHKPGLRKALVEAMRDNPGYANIRQLAALLEPAFPGITTKQVTGARRDLEKQPPKGYALESRHIGRLHHYRLVPRAEVGADPAEIITQVRPVLREIQAELRKSMASMSTTFLMERVAFIERVLSHVPEVIHS